MTVKSTFSVDIDSAQFDKFKKLFDQYSSTLYKLPGAWKEVGKAEKPLINDFERGVAALLAQNAMTQELSDAEGKRNNALVRTDSLWKSMAKSSTSFAKSILSVSETVLKWGTLGLSGAVGGSLFGIDRMSKDVSSDRQAALGYGMSIGELKAFRANFSRMMDPDQFLKFVNEAETNVASKAFSAFTSLTGRTPSGKTQDDAINAFEAIYALVQKTPTDQLMTTLNAWGAPLTAEQANIWKGTRPDEAGKLVNQDRYDATRFDVPNSLAWQNLTTEFTRNWDNVASAFERRLGDLAGPIGKVSDGFTKMITSVIDSDLLKQGIVKLGGWLDDFGSKIDSPEFQRHIQQLLSDTGDISKGFRDFWNELKDDLPAIQNAFYVIAHPIDAAASKAADLAMNAVGPPDLTARSNLSKTPAFQQWWRTNYGNGYNKNDFEKSLSGLEEIFKLPAGTLDKQWAAESDRSFSPTISSRAGAVGAFQFTAETAKAMGINRSDPLESAYAAAMMMSQLQKQYGSDMKKSLAGYNWGSGNVDNAISVFGKDWLNYAPEETRNYVAKNTGTKAVDGRPLPPIRLEVHVMNSTGGNTNVAIAQMAPGFSQ